MIHLKIMTPDDGVMIDEDIIYIDVLTLDGHIGLQQDITPMVAKLKQGPTTITKADKTKRTGILLDAVLYVDRTVGIKIMASKFVWEDQVDLEETKKRIIEIEKLMQKLHPNDKKLIYLEDEMIMAKNIVEALSNHVKKA